MLSKLCDALVWLILLAVLVTAGLLLFPRMAGYEVYGMLSNSMEPAFRTGSMIYVKPAVPTEVAVGDAITYTFDSGDGDLMVTLRVVEKDDGVRRFTTRGDADEGADLTPVPYDRLVGQALYTVPHLGTLALFLQSRQGLYAGVGVMAAVILLSVAGTLLDKRRLEAAEDPQAPSAPAPAEVVKSIEEPAPAMKKAVTSDGQPSPPAASTEIAAEAVPESIEELETPEPALSTPDNL